MNPLKKSNELYRDTFIVIFSALLYAIGINFFIDHLHLMPAGVAGISQLVSLLLLNFEIKIDFIMLYLFLQLFLSISVIKFIGKRFALLSIVQFTLASLFSIILPRFQLLDELVLSVFFGGLCLGSSAALAFKANASTGGTDFIVAFFMNRSQKPIILYMTLANILVLFFASITVGYKISLYSIFLQFIITITTTYLFDNNNLLELKIISKRAQPLYKAMHQHSKRGVTLIEGQGTYSSESNSVLLTIVTKQESHGIISLLKSIDDDAFIIITPCSEVKGKFRLNQFY